tara:strand:+ start:2374 stop:4023 length:1650 start_codon:yes stop_codon:yes gene_type:complete
MKRKKILFCSEGHHLPTGYSVYTKEVLSRLCTDPRFEVAELACYTDAKTAAKHQKGWKIFPNQPEKDSSDWADYKRYPTAEFGDFTFNHVLLEFMPDFVMDIRDWWMFEFQQRSAFRKFYNWCIMPTVDAAPQNAQWIDTFASADSVFAYSEFGRDVLTSQCGALNFIDVASPCASKEFSPVLDKAKHRESLGLSPDSFILGTVMRNQRRKLYPDLFRVFREFIDTTKATDAYLHCHTSYPDIGWEIPELLQKYGLTNRVLFTYKCKNCGKLSCNFFDDVISHCYSCGTYKRELVGINNQLERHELAMIYNLFDVYIQYANSEGFGMPQLEATQCGVPLITVDYSAMQSVADNVGAIKIPPLALPMECETGCHRAIPNNEFALVEICKLYNSPREKLKQLGFAMRQKTRERYNWDNTAKIWADYFAATPVKDLSETWLSPPQVLEPLASSVPDGLTIKEQVNFLFTNVLRCPELIGSHQWRKTIKDLTYKCTAQSTDVNYYFSESHINNNVRNWSSFSVENACEHMLSMRKVMNDWEKLRADKLRSMSV